MTKKPSNDTTIRGRAPSISREEPRMSLVVYHRDGASAVTVVPGAAIVVGRERPADLVIDDRSLSRRHARFTADATSVVVEDLGSTNGTWVGGERVKSANVAIGARVRLGDVSVSLHALAPVENGLQGIDGNDRFMTALEDEVTRARSFERPLALLTVHADSAQAANPGDAHVSRWACDLVRELRPVDRVGLYSDDTISIALPETTHDAAHEMVTKLLAKRPALRAGIAIFPQDGASANELVSAARASLRSTTPNARVAMNARPNAAPTANAFVIEGDAMREVYATVAQIAASLLPVLIQGETGTGKELVARAIHEGSARSRGPLRSINCAAIPATLLEAMLFGHERGAFTGAEKTTKGIFEQANGGTVLLDEVGELSPTAQAALLRVLETKRVTRIGADREVPVDVRVVAATHRDLEAMCGAEAFRWDLFYRLNAVMLRLPPLRERISEIAPLVQFFLAEANRENDKSVGAVDDDASECLRRYAWPGNVRELKNVIERAVVIARGGSIGVADLPERVRGGVKRAEASDAGDASERRDPNADDDGGGDYKERVQKHMQRFETELIVRALRESGGNQAKAASALQIPVRTLTHKMQQLGIKKRF